MAVNGIGEELRRERLRQALTLDDIVQRTRISPRSLEAIEAEAFERLPGTVFTRNFVRLYALELNLDADALVSRLPKVDIESAPLPNPPSRGGRTKWDPRLVAALVSALWLVIAGGAAGGGWYYWNHFRRTVSTVASTPAPKSNAPTAASIATAVSLPVSQQSALADSPNFNSSASQSASNQTAPEGFDNNRPVQVVLTAREAAWVQVSADGRTAFVGLLHPNDKRTIAADAQVRILTGNAGGLDISLNGKTLDPIGPRGQVRTVRLTAEGPQFVPQNPTASSPL